MKNKDEFLNRIKKAKIEQEIKNKYKIEYYTTKFEAAMVPLIN